MPKKAATQSQKSEPGPPETSAVAVPATLPVPNLSRNRGGESLERAHTGFVGAFAEKGGATQEIASGQTELADLDKTQFAQCRRFPCRIAGESGKTRPKGRC